MKWVCPHCPSPRLSLQALDMHLRFACAGLGRVSVPSPPDAPSDISDTSSHRLTS